MSTSSHRDFAVSVFVVHRDRILLHRHQKLDRWLPPGGHIEPNELPDDAAIREVLEETGVSCQLVGDQRNAISGPDQPQQLTRPLGMQLATFHDGHQHIDFVYLARALSEGDGRGSWFTATELDNLDLTDEVRHWCLVALADNAGMTEA